MTKYSITHPKITVWVWYRAGTLVKFQVKKGSLKALEAKPYKNLQRWVPLYEVEIDTKNFGDFEYKLLNGQAPNLYSQFNTDWFQFYYNLNNIQYKFTASDGRALKSIIKYLEENGGPEEARANWQAILANWHKLPSFYRNKTNLVFVNAQLSTIITILKDEQSSTAQANRDSDDLRRQFKS